LYEEYHREKYNSAKLSEEVQKLLSDTFVTDRKGIFEYVLGGSQDTKLLNIRVFTDAVKKDTYSKQTAEAEIKGKSNCPHCVIGHESNKKKIWKLTEMDADHVAAWSKGGKTTSKNCEMLCKTHNRAKGNR
jgi:5-methylcytosine-specific restriction endonuclease McrA